MLFLCPGNLCNKQNGQSKFTLNCYLFACKTRNQLQNCAVRDPKCTFLKWGVSSGTCCSVSFHSWFQHAWAPTPAEVSPSAAQMQSKCKGGWWSKQCLSAGEKFAGMIGSVTCLVCKLFEFKPLNVWEQRETVLPELLKKLPIVKCWAFCLSHWQRGYPCFAVKNWSRGKHSAPLWLFSIWSLDDLIDIQCAVYFIRWKSTHWGIVSFPRVTLWQRVAAAHIKMIKAWPKSPAAQVEKVAQKLLIDGLD